MKQLTLGELVFEKRREKGLTQNELANQCDLDTRTIQRIEKGEVKPYFFTLKLISQTLEYDFIQELNRKPWQFSPEDEDKYRRIFKKRRTIRIVIMIIALTFILAVVTTSPHGMTYFTQALFFYLSMVAIIIANVFIWRCPVCRTILGNPFSTKFCPGCGFKFL